MMKIKCSNCGTEYDITEDEFGKFVKCEVCGKGFVAGASNTRANGDEKTVEGILGIRKNVEQEAARQQQYTRQHKEEQNDMKNDVHQRGIGVSLEIMHVGGVSIALFFAVLMANIIFAGLSYMIVGNQLGKVIDRLDSLEKRMEQMDVSRHYDASQIYDRMGRMKLY